MAAIKNWASLELLKDAVLLVLIYFTTDYDHYYFFAVSASDMKLNVKLFC